jgi:hypothetical protein
MLKSRKFWCYDVCNEYNLTDEIFAAYKQKGKFYEDANYFYESLIGTGPHPSIKNKPGAAEPTVLTFNNVLVDINTLKIIFYLFPSSKITTLKFSNNNFNLKSLDYLINNLLTKPNGIYNFTYEWNDKLVVNGHKYSYKDILEHTILDEADLQEMLKTQEILTTLITKVPNRLEALCLRGNLLGDETAIKIFNGLKNELNYLRILNLYKNELTDNCIKVFGEMMLVNRRLEEINFGNNHLTDVSLNILKSNYGKFLMNETDLEEYKKFEKERQDIIRQNAKLKAAKKPELEVPHLDELKEVDGTIYRVKNDVLKLFNLTQNNFTEKSFDDLIGILDGLPDSMVTIDDKTYNQEQKIKLNDSSNPAEYYKRIYLLK